LWIIIRVQHINISCLFTKTICGGIASCSFFLVFNFACKEVVLLQVGHTFIVFLAFICCFVYTFTKAINKVLFLFCFSW